MTKTKSVKTKAISLSRRSKDMRLQKPDIIGILDKVDDLRRRMDALHSSDDPSFLKNVRDFYSVSTTWSSNALEGNTLNETETKIVIEDGITVGGKPVRDILEAVGHAKAYQFLWECTQRDIEIEDIFKLHSLFYSLVDSQNAGKLRSVPVYITGSNYIPPKPSTLFKHMEALEHWMNGNALQMHPILYAARLHLAIAEIHPFIDGNGRTARLAMNMILVKNGYVPVSIPPILRNEYLSTLEVAHPHIDEAHEKRGKNGVERFEYFIAERVYESEKDFLRFLAPNYKKNIDPSESDAPWMEPD